ncbi:MAG: beta-galactosidase [Nitrospirota bacterium]
MATGKEMDIRQSLRRLALCLALLTSACGAGSGGDTSSAPVQPVSTDQVSKVFALMDVGDSTSVFDSFAARATVDGLAFRTSWRVLEPQDGIYDWTTLDAAFDTVRARGKQLTLHVGVSSIGIPNWLAALGVVMYTYNTPMGVAVTEPLPWDATFLSRYTQFAAALAAHIQARGDTSLLYAVSDGVPVAEMSIVGCQNGILSGGIAYSRANYLNAWKTTVDAHAAAFSTTRLFISAPIAVICIPDNDGKAFYTEVMNHALTKSAQTTAFAADLNAAGSMRLVQVDASIRTRAALAFQMIWSSTNDTQNSMQGTLKEAVCQGIGSGARYFEIYKIDISSSDAAIHDAIQRARAGQPC